jgi:hypothetical protein
MVEVSNHKRRLRQVAVAAVFAVAVLFIGCGKRVRQSTVEAEAAALLIQRLMFHDAEFPGGTLTNVSQLFLQSSNAPGYPYWLDEKLRAFGAMSGFSNSVFKKYVVVPPGISNRHGELVILSSQAFSDSKSAPQRTSIYKAPNGYFYTLADETQIQSMFNEAGLRIPDPELFPPVPPGPLRTSHITLRSFSEHGELILQRIAVALGLGTEHWLTVLVALSIVALGLIALVILFWLKRR